MTDQVRNVAVQDRNDRELRLRTRIDALASERDDLRDREERRRVRAARRGERGRQRRCGYCGTPCYSAACDLHRDLLALDANVA